MKDRRKLDRDSLRALGLPKALGEEMLEVDELGLDRPEPTAELLSATMARCEEALKRIKPKRERQVLPPVRPLGWVGAAPALAELVGAMATCISTRVAAFTQSSRDEPVMFVVDNHGVIDPELWASDPSLRMLNQICRGVDKVVEPESGKPLDRLIVLKENLDAYDERDLEVMRQAIEDPMTKDTYLVSAKNAGRFRGLTCAVIGKEVLFEIDKGEQPDSFEVKDPIIDFKEAARMYSDFLKVKKHAFRVFVGGKVNPKLKGALGSSEKLLAVLKEV